MDKLPTFVTKETLTTFVWWIGILLPGLIILGFFFFYNKALKNRSKEVEDNKKNLMNFKNRSNGIKKEVHE